MAFLNSNQDFFIGTLLKQKKEVFLDLFGVKGNLFAKMRVANERSIHCPFKESFTVAHNNPNGQVNTRLRQKPQVMFDFFKTDMFGANRGCGGTAGMLEADWMFLSIYLKKLTMAARTITTLSLKM